MFEDRLTSKDVPKMLSFTNDIFGGPNGDDDERADCQWPTESALEVQRANKITEGD
jgi:hypothetical protein